MMVLAILKITFLATLVTVCQGQGQDATLVAGSFGEHIVGVTITRIRANCIFSDDRLFLRRTAYVMSRDGSNTDTYRPGFDGGIWQVSKTMFEATKNCSNTLLATACNRIQANLSITWQSTQWSDLRKPLYSGIAAALSSLLALGNSKMPGSVADQAVYWASMYGRPEQDFISEVAQISSLQCADELDLAFILDASGSVSYSDFQLTLAAAADIVDVMDVSPDKVRIADIVFSTYASVSFDFDQYTTTDDAKRALRQTPKVSGGTNTAAALNLAASVLNDPTRGARANAKKVAVLVTDGQSNSFYATVNAAQQLKDAGTTVFAVGVGGYRLSELQAVASAPICTHVLTLTTFDHINSIVAEIQKSTCNANTKFNKNITKEITDPPTPQTTETSAPAPHETVQASVSCGILNIYVSTSDPKPGPAVFDNRYLATPDARAVLHIVETQGQGSPVYVTVVGTRLPAAAAALRNCSDYNWTMSVVPRKNITVRCEENGVARTCTKNDIRNTGLCPSDSGVSYPVENPCTLQNRQNNVLRHSYPYDPTKFLQCDMKGRYYITLCPGGDIFNDQTRECGFTSPGSAPPGNSAPLPSTGGGPGNGGVTGIVNVTVAPIAPGGLSSSCTPQMLAQNKYYHPYSPDKSKFIQCDEWGKAFVMPCADGTEWSQSNLTCVQKSVACTFGEMLPDPCDPHKYYQCLTAGQKVSFTCPASLYYHPNLKVCNWGNVQGPPAASCSSG